MKIRRAIRLKEIGASVRRLSFPSEVYLVGRTGLSTQYGYTYITDEDGLALTTLPITPRDRSIFLVGGSSIEAIYCDINKRASFVLQEKLLLAGFPNACYNMGASGCTSLNLFNSIVNKLIGKSGDIIYFVPSNDVRAFEFKGGYVNRSKYFANIIPTTNETRNSALFDENKNNLFPMLRMIAAFCREYGFRFYVSGVIHRDSDKKFEEITSMTKEFCQKENIDFISIDDYPHGSFYDSVHLTEIGDDYVAGKIFDFLKNKGGGYISSFLEKKEVGFDGFSRFSLKEKNEITLFIDVECLGEVSRSSLLAHFEFYGKNQPSDECIRAMGLGISKAVGCFKYLNLPEEGRRCVMQYTFKFPQEIPLVGIALKKWSMGQNYIVHSAVAYSRLNGVI